MDLPPVPRRVAARDALPPEPLGYDLTAPVLLLHTVQTREAYAVLQRDGVLRCPDELVEPDLEPAYRWLREQQAQRVAGARGDPLLWFWASTTREDLADALVEGWDRSKPRVLLTCRVPRERALLSHFLDWHAVLNGCVLWPSWLAEDEVERRDEEFHRRHGLDPRRPFALSAVPPAVQAEVRRSWEGIFDLRAYPAGEVWQATVEHLDAGEVVDAVVLE